MKGQVAFHETGSRPQTEFRTVKSEFPWPVAGQARKQAENCSARYIGGFYNPVGRYSSLEFESPFAFEQEVAEAKKPLATKPGQATCFDSDGP